jgi:DHA2 family multidrug resistance protein
MVPIPFCFIAITNAAYVGLPREASNQVSGIINFVRNVGGSILIALTGALVTDRTLFHESRLQDHMQPGSIGYSSHLSAMTGAFMSTTGNRAVAHQMAQASIYQQMLQQASTLAYADIYRVLAWVSVLLVGFAFLLSKNRPGEGAPKGEAVH